MNDISIIDDRSHMPQKKIRKVLMAMSMYALDDLSSLIGTTCTKKKFEVIIENVALVVGNI